MLNYKDLGFKAGLEVHQQLDTKKLFCDCPSLVNDPNKASIRIKRYLRAVVGETGEIDIAARHEEAKKKYYVYEAAPTSSCLIEIDEEPPKTINQKALEIAVNVARLLHMSIVDEIQVMRKIVIDGSNTTGFQRTALIGRNGYVETAKGNVAIPTLLLEEEAAKKIDQNEESVTYRLDRLGVALLEISTDASLQDPEHVKEAASIIGMMLRSVGSMKRGIGSIRQDVNVSVKGGARTEIKGFQELKSIPRVIEQEIQRQLNEIKQGKTLKNEVRKAEPGFTTSFLRPLPGAARLYPETDVVPIKIPESMLEAKLPNLLSDEIKQLQETYRIPKEFAEEAVKRKISLPSYFKEFKSLEPLFIANTLIATPKEIKSRFGLDTKKLTHADFKEVLNFYEKKQIPKEAIIDILTKKLRNEKYSLTEFKTVSDAEIEKAIKLIIDENKGASLGALMGIAMKRFRGKVEGKKVSEILQKLLN